MILLEVFEDCDGLADTLAIVELERGDLAAGIALGVWRLAIFRTQQVDFFFRDRDVYLSQEHAHRPWIGSKRIVELHIDHLAVSSVGAEYTTGRPKAGTPEREPKKTKTRCGTHPGFH